MKTPFALALTVAATQAISGEFIRGCETGIFIMKEEQMQDYACPEVEITQQIQTYMDMVLPMKMMFQNMNKGQSNSMIDFIEKSTHQIGMIYSLFSEDYDGGEFCQGLIFSHQAGQLMLTVGRGMFAEFFGGKSKTDFDSNPMLHDLLQA